jgi:hypothetical protein|tara:strand:- start:506 stop:640 length:135 start_codon:yes stop_codon:yes gene_type:complete
MGVQLFFSLVQAAALWTLAQRQQQLLLDGDGRCGTDRPTARGTQ